jgi:hypothetical protein
MMTDVTDKQLRDAGYTSDARKYPHSERAFRCLCAFNGIDPDKAPMAWRFAPNAHCRDAWERVAATTIG